MGVIQELYDFMEKLRPWSTVDPYEQGLMIQFGRVKPLLKKPSSFDKKDLERIIQEEKAQREKNGKAGFARINPFIRPEYPEDWAYSFLGNPIHPEKIETYDRPPGTYWHIPEIVGIQRIATKQVVDDVWKLDSLTVYPTDYDSSIGPIMISARAPVRITSAYGAYVNVSSVEDNYIDMAIICLSRLARGKSYADFRSPEALAEIENTMKAILNGERGYKETYQKLHKDERYGVVGEKWKVETQAFGITNIAPHSVNRTFHEGIPRQLEIDMASISMPRPTS